MKDLGMKDFDIRQLSRQFAVRYLHPEDMAAVYEVLRHNTIFYQYHPPMVTIESIREDMQALPPGKGYEDKHYIGFFQEGTLIAVMDLIVHYPRQGTAHVGFFAMNVDFQGKGIGTAIISDSIAYLARLGFEKLRLGIDNGNPQSKGFWMKNGLTWNGKEIPNDFSSYLIMERTIHEDQITIRKAVTEADREVFWGQLHDYFKRDIFPDPDDKDRAYFLGDEYFVQIQKIHDRLKDRCHYLFFCDGGQDIGFALPVIYNSEDGKCFILEFCVYPEFRGNGTGTKCAMALLNWMKDNNALYAELNYGGNEMRLHFWECVGFMKNGFDEWGEPLMILPPEGDVPITVEILKDPEDWQLKKLENGFLKEIGEELPDENAWDRLIQAIRSGKIRFFIAKRGYRAVGMCSVAGSFSTFACTDTGVFEDFYIEPVFRKKGIARKLAETAQKWCMENGMASLTVCCAPCDEGMYQALGFQIRLGTTFAYCP